MRKDLFISRSWLIGCDQCSSFRIDGTLEGAPCNRYETLVTPTLHVRTKVPINNRSSQNKEYSSHA